MTLVKFNRPARDQRFPFAGTPFYGDLFNNLFDPNFQPEAPSLVIPPVNISETEDQYLIELASPGYRKEDFQLNLEDGKITVSLEHKIASGEEDQVQPEVKNYTRREYTLSAFSRSFNLPEEADQNAVHAGYENGILRISIGKREEVKLRKIARNIEIK